MADIAKLVVRLEAESSRLTTELEKANRKLSSFEQSSTQILSTIKAGVVGFAAAISVDALTSAAKASIEYADNIAKAADKIGLTTDALQELRFAAERTGVEQSTLDMAMQRFSRRVGEVAQGTGVLKDVFEQYGIKVRDSNGYIRSLDDILGEYANTVKNASSDQERLRLAFKAFDSEGAALVNTLRNGKSGLDDLRQAAKDAGVVMEEELLRKAEVINDRWDTLVQTIGTRFKSAVISTISFITGTAEAVTEQAASLAQNREQIRNYTKALDNLNTVMENIRQQAGDEHPALKIYQQQADDLQKKINVLNGEIDILTGKSLPPPPALPKTKPEKIKKEEILPDEDAHVEAYKQYISMLNQRVDAFRRSLMTERELEVSHYDERRAFSEALYNESIITEQERNAQMEELARQHEENLTEINRREEAMRLRQRAAGLGAAAQIFSAAAALMDKEGSKMSIKQKRLAQIGILMSTAQAIMNALAVPPYPLGLALAAGAALTGAQQLQNLNRAASGGVSVSSPISTSGSSVDLSSSQTAPTSSTDSNSTTSVTIQFLGDVYGLDDFQEVVLNTISGAINDRDVVIINSDSRQAQELTT